MTALSLTASPNTLFDRFAKLNWGIITILIALAFIGVLMHFSVSSGAWTDMPLKHGIRFGAYHLYAPALLKPAPRALAAQLWSLKHGGLDGAV